MLNYILYGVITIYFAIIIFAGIEKLIENEDD